MVKQFSIPKSVCSALLVLPVFLLNPVEQIQLDQGQVKVGFKTAAAQDDEEGSGRETRRAMAVSDSVNRKLAEVSELMNPEEGEADLQAALQEAQSIDTDNWNEFEKAQLYNLMGGIYVQLERYKDAIRYYKQYVETPSVPPANQLNVSYYLAQLYLATENYPQAIRLLEDYIARSEIVGADHYYKLGQAYYMDEQMDKALPNINKAVEKYEESDRVPPEGLLQYQMALYHGRENYNAVIGVLEKLVRHYPKMSHYRTLASMYGAANRPKDQMHMFDAVYTMGGLTKDKEFRMLASLYLESEYPFKAAKILKDGLEKDIVEESSDNLELLSVSWSLAKEQEKALPVMERAAQKAEDGELYSRLAQMYLGDDQFEKAIDAARAALNRGGLKKPARIHFNIGVAQYNLENFDEALESLREARKDKTLAKQANTWIRLVKGEKERLEKLREGQKQELVKPPELRESA